ncbi:S26 family signal peptidase [Micromonospora sp. CA-111912]|uniref:S26 family signal peptidase n=1 Tax=Micromonospora sp. CA-111912 TaxID=3239955 RepID=UPI003D8C2288
MTGGRTHQLRPRPPTAADARRIRRRFRWRRAAPGLAAGGLGAVVALGALDTPWAALPGGLFAVALFGAGSVTLRRHFVAVTVRGTSMLPAYGDGDRVLVRRAGTPAVGQVVVVERPAHGWRLPPLPRGASAAVIANRIWMIKRVAAVAGDPMPHGLPAPPDGPGGRSVPRDRLVLLGDNRADSVDSRQLGLFPTERVLGAVLSEPAPGVTRAGT